MADEITAGEAEALHPDAVAVSSPNREAGGLGPEARTALGHVDGTRTLRQVIEASSLPEDAGGRAVQELVDEGLISVLPPEDFNHTDKELIMLESLVGRIPPFARGNNRGDY